MASRAPREPRSRRGVAGPIVLQNFIMPHLRFGAPAELYVRSDELVTPILGEDRLVLRRGGLASFDTYFNGLTVQNWRRYAGIETLSATVSGAGEFLVRIGLHQRGASQRWLLERHLHLAPGTPAEIGIEAWPDLVSGMVYLEVEALSDGEITGGSFATTTPPVNEVKLGVVITHFNRKAYVVPAIERMRAGLLADPVLGDKIKLVVVDNSQNLTADDVRGATLLPNRNLGGAGGFMRGLLHLEDEGSFTHCLFMDDDASCELESIRRAFTLLRYATIPKFAVAGSLLRELEPARLFEKGAHFDGLCRPRHVGRDMLRIEDLLETEVHENRPDYGGWWFFAFALRDVEAYAFPFFVRGDDVLFSLTNRFFIATQNGISCWCEDFSLKHGPLPTYLDARYHLLISMARLGMGRIGCSLVFLKLFLRSAFGYNYASARAVRMALETVCADPAFWRENLDMQAVRQAIGAFASSEAMRPIDRDEYQLEYPSPHEGRMRRLLRRLTLSGFLVPEIFLKRGTAFQHKTFYGVLRQIFLFKNVLYFHEPSGRGYLARHDKRQFFGEMWRGGRQLLRFWAGFERIRGAQRDALPGLTSRRFWEEVYATPADTAASATPAAPVAQPELAAIGR